MAEDNNNGHCSRDALPLLCVGPCDHEDVLSGQSPSSSPSAPPPPAAGPSRPGLGALDSVQPPPSRASAHTLSFLSTATLHPTTTQTNAERNDRDSRRDSTTNSGDNTPREGRQREELWSALTVQRAGARGKATPHSQLVKSYYSPTHPTTAIANWYAQQLNEMQKLQKEAFDLNERLRVLKHEAHLAQQQSMEMEGRASPLSVEGMSMAQLWKPVVERQRQRLEYAQRENQQLRKSVRDLKKMAKNLRRALLKRANRYAVLAETLQFPPLYPINLDVSTDDCAIFQKMVVDIDDMHANVGDALWVLQKKTRKSTRSGSFCKGKARVDANMSIFVETVSCERVPFRKAQVERAMLLLREDKKTSGCRRYNAQHFGGAPQLVVTKSKSQHSSSVKERGIYRARCANRSFVDGTQRSISLAIGYVDPVDAMDKSAPGYLLRIRSWTILTERVRAGGHTETLIQSYTTVAPVLIREPYPFRWDRETVERVVIPEFTRSFAAGSQALENVLIEQASQ